MGPLQMRIRLCRRSYGLGYGTGPQQSPWSLTTFILVVNASLMNVAIPTMVDEFDTTVTVIQGAVSLYSLVIAALVLPAGTLPSRHSTRRCNDSCVDRLCRWDAGGVD